GARSMWRAPRNSRKALLNRRRRVVGLEGMEFVLDYLSTNHRKWVILNSVLPIFGPERRVGGVRQMKVLRLGRFRSMEVDHPPFLVPTNVGLGESPVIGSVIAIQHALALQASRNHGGVAINSHMEVGSAVAQ